MNIISKIFGGRETEAAKQATAAEIAVQIQQLLPNVHSGTLQFWGVWFGRPHDNCHKIIKADAEGDCLVLHFNDEETLQVWHPQACQFDSNKFVIGLASRVLWQWYWYGRPHFPGNLMSYDFVRNQTGIHFTTTFPHAGDAKPSFDESAVQIH